MYPGIPYGAAPAWCFPVFEYGSYLLLLCCLFHAVKQGPRHVWYLLGGTVFGLLLEYMEVVMGSYTYGHFQVMLGRAPMDIPFCIGAGWGIIMYSARLFSDRLGLSLWAAAALDTLLALNIDLSMDTVAYRLHMWHWDWSNHPGMNPLTAQWFGIPYANFVGWQTVVMGYSSFSRLFERYVPGVKAAWVALLSIICSIIVLYGTEQIWPFLSKIGFASFQRFITICIILAILVIWHWRRRIVQAGSLPGIVWWVPAWFHLFFTGCLFILGFYLENSWMTTASIVNLLAGIVIHILPVSFRKS